MVDIGVRVKWVTGPNQGNEELMSLLEAIPKCYDAHEVIISPQCEVVPAYSEDGKVEYTILVHNLIAALDRAVSRSPAEELRNQVNEKHMRLEFNYQRYRGDIKKHYRPILDAIFTLGRKYLVEEGYVRAPDKDEITTYVIGHSAGGIDNETVQRTIRDMVNPICECPKCHDYHTVPAGRRVHAADCGEMKCQCCPRFGVLFSPVPGRYYVREEALQQAREIMQGLVPQT